MKLKDLGLMQPSGLNSKNGLPVKNGVVLTPEVLTQILSFRKRYKQNLNPEDENTYEQFLSPLWDEFVAHHGVRLVAGNFHQGLASSIIDAKPLTHYANRLITSLGEIVICTDIGGSRSRYKVNEDNYFVLAQENLVGIGVLDGAGGSKNGLLASQIATAGLSVSIPESPLAELFEKISELVGLYAHDGYIHDVDEEVINTINGGYTAGVVALIRNFGGEKVVEIGASGDSKVLTLRRGSQGFYKAPEGTSAFQNMAQFEIDQGIYPAADIYIHPKLNILIGALGLRGESYLSPTFSTFIACPGDGTRIILGSDGIFDVISEYELIQMANNFSNISDFHRAAFNLAILRHSDTDEFMIQHSKSYDIPKRVSSYEKSGYVYVRNGGDNITLAAMDL